MHQGKIEFAGKETDDYKEISLRGHLENDEDSDKSKKRNQKQDKGEDGDETKEEMEEFEFNQDIENESGINSPGWLSYQKRIK